MSNLREAAQQALEALKCLVETHEMGNTIRADIVDAEEAITALKAALEQPEQEPVAWIQSNHLQLAQRGPFSCRVEPTQRHPDFVPLYTHPPRREPVQEAHIKELEQARERDNIAFKQLLAQRDALLEAQNGKKVRNHEGGTRYQPPVEDAAITSLRAALEKPEQEQAEPVAWMTPGQDLHLNNGERFRFSDWTPLYTHPPRRETEQAEPVAWRYKGMMGMPWSLSDDGYYVSCKRDKGYTVEPLYTHPPRREWRGLKNQELYGLLRQSGVTSYLHQDDRMQGAFERCLEAYSRLIEAKMKELNHA